MSKTVKRADTKSAGPVTLDERNDFDLRHGVPSGWYQTADVHALRSVLAEVRREAAAAAKHLQALQEENGKLQAELEDLARDAAGESI